MNLNGIHFTHDTKFGFAFNTIIVLSLVPENEMYNSNRLLEHIHDNKGNHKFTTQHLKAKTHHELNLLIQYLIDPPKAPRLPLLHIEYHGDYERGIELPSGEFVNWARWTSMLSAINAAAGLGMLVFMSGCHGESVRKNVTYDRISPFAFLISAKSKVTADELLSTAKKFYSAIFAFSIQDVKSALEGSLSFKSLEREVCMGFALLHLKSTGRVRIEEVITQFISLGFSLSEARKIAKTSSKHIAVAFEHFVDVFYGGVKNLAWDYSDVLKFSNEIRLFRDAQKG